MESLIELIHRFNTEAGLLEQGYSDYLESSFQVEEAMEGFKCPTLMRAMGLPENIDTTPKNFSRFVVASAMAEHRFSLPDVERLDKACDSVVFAIGSMTKLRLSPEQITRALNTVMHANFSKLAMPKDSFGKLTKPDNFVGPEEKLQEILDER